MQMSLRFGHDKFTDEILNRSIATILNDNMVMSVATVKGDESYINTAYFSFNSKIDLFMLTEPFKQHSMNIANNNSVAVAIYDSQQPWDKPKKGIQIFGECELAHGLTLLEGTKLYLTRFSGLSKWIKHADDFAKNIINSKLYVIRTKSLKVFDEQNLGDDNFVSLSPL